MKKEEVSFEKKKNHGQSVTYKIKHFALDIIKVCNKVKSEKRESVLTNQLIRSGTSIGACTRMEFGLPAL